MANRIGSERHSPSRLPMRLLGSVLVLGALLAWWGTRDQRHLFGEALREPVAAGGGGLSKVAGGGRALLDRGSEILKRECADCYQKATRTPAPRFHENVGFYRHEVSVSGGRPEL